MSHFKIPSPCDSAVDSVKVYKHKYLSQVVLRLLKHYVALDGVVVAIQFVLF